MQYAVLLAEEIDHGLQHAQHNEHPHALAAERKLRKPEERQQAHDDERQQEPVREQQKNVRQLKSVPGRHEAEAPENVADYRRGEYLDRKLFIHGNSIERGAGKCKRLLFT